MLHVEPKQCGICYWFIIDFYMMHIETRAVWYVCVLVINYNVVQFIIYYVLHAEHEYVEEITQQAAAEKEEEVSRR